jgi:hypothetical protein
MINRNRYRYRDNRVRVEWVNNNKENRDKDYRKYQRSK